MKKKREEHKQQNIECQSRVTILNNRKEYMLFILINLNVVVYCHNLQREFRVVVPATRSLCLRKDLISAISRFRIQV